jgi:hypothetical protein
VRSIPSLLFLLLQQLAEDEKEAISPPSGQPTPKDFLLTVSWFNPSNPLEKMPLRDAWHLHEGQRTLARERGLCYLGAGESPSGSREAVTAGLNHPGRCLIATICGHGASQESGIWLADGLWKGEGCQLSAAEFWIFVSCSIGRLGQTLKRDVEGFCIELAVHRALAVLACRWQIHSAEAVRFANSVVRFYLDLRLAHPSGRPPKAHLRSRAVNQARRALLQNGPNEIVSVNTAAAFELFGLS